jgi:hypothetical protein
MWVKVTSAAGACVLCAAFFVGGTVITPPSLMWVTFADDPENPVAAPVGRSHSPSVHVDAETGEAVDFVLAPADVAAAALLPGMDPASLTINPDGSLVYHGTTGVGVDTPGWSTIARGGSIEMVRGPVPPAPVPAAAGPLPSPMGGPFPAEGMVPEASVPVQAVSDPGLPIDHGAPHLTSLMNLPPGTTAVPDQQGHGMTYLRDLWRAYQTQEISGGDALLLLTQRPMNADAAPPPGMPASPQSPNSPTHLPPAV